MKREEIASELLKMARSVTAMMGMFVVKDDIEFIYDPWTHHLQIGMGGEWWMGTVKPGKNIFRHRKERVDPAYVPVEVEVQYGNTRIAFDVTGGFYGKFTRFELTLG
jgi:glycyl-tRNA synthetase alpha subunit